MAYGDYGAFVYRNGKRRPDKEDVGVFDTDESCLPSGARIFVNILKLRQKNDDSWDNHSHHAVLGDGPVRLCGYKSHAELWAIRKGKGRKEKRERINLPAPDYDNDEWELKDQSGKISIRIDKKKYTWKWSFSQYNGNRIDLSLIEPDGTVWTSTCGYLYGAGHMD